MRVMLLSLVCLLMTLGGAARAADADFDSKVVPLLKRYCYECHGDGAESGDLALDKYKTIAEVREAEQAWGKVIKYARSRVMPPPEAEHALGDADRDTLVAALVREVYQVDEKRPDPGPAVVRRLNHVEYKNTIRDLTGVRFETAAVFPQDDTGYGFDVIGDVLTIPPMLVEKYMVAAEKILSEAIPTEKWEVVRGKGGNGITTRPARRIEGPLKALFVKYCGEAGADGVKSVPHNPVAARGVLGDFMRKAWRRDVERGEIERVTELYELARRKGGSFHESVKHGMVGVLVSPSFLFRGVTDPAPAPRRGATTEGGVKLVGEYELASRLSYFLWSTTPDGELTDLARKGELRKNLPAQVKRMLASEKAKAFVENFAGQWLQFRNLDAVHPDGKLFKEYDDGLRDAMRRETELFFESIVKEDRSLLEVMTGDYTFVNERLANHYGLKDAGVKGGEFKRVSLARTQRRGVLTQGSILTLTSNPTRTSPVKRGKWVLESLLGTAPPPPPPDVPLLEGDGGKKAEGTLRQRLEKHREDPNCASCHAEMDPIGFALENFDAIGEWRDKDGKDAIDVAGSIGGGDKFAGPVELADILVKTRRNDFYRAAAEAAMTYALGRGVEPYDLPAVDAVVARLKKDDGRVSALVMGVVESVPFQHRR